jgi:TonB family protein
LLAAVLLLAALAGWYWYSNQPKEVSANSGAPEKTEFLSPATTSSTSGSIDPTPFNAISGSDASRSATNLPGARSDGKGMVATSSGYSRPVIPTPNIEELPHRSAEAAKKPSIGKVHLAAPVVNRSSASDSGSDSLPAIEGNAAVGMDAGNLKLLVGKSNQPAAPPAPPAPVPAGGDLKQARLLSSVAPIYPQLARNQRVSGDVRIDALIDVNGRVTATKVVSGPALLYQSAIDAVRQWKYQPATLNGKPMAMHLTITVQFKM